MSETDKVEKSKVEYLLKINGIKGESKKDAHTEEIDILEFGWSERNGGTAGTGTGIGGGAVSAKDFKFKAVVNKASPGLFLHCANGKMIDEALLTCRESGGKQEEYLKIKFTDFIVSSYAVSPDPVQFKPVDTFEFCFTKIELSYAAQDPKTHALGEYETHYLDQVSGKSE